MLSTQLSHTLSKTHVPGHRVPISAEATAPRELCTVARPPVSHRQLPATAVPSLTHRSGLLTKQRSASAVQHAPLKAGLPCRWSAKWLRSPLEWRSSSAAVCKRRERRRGSEERSAQLTAWNGPSQKPVRTVLDILRYAQLALCTAPAVHFRRSCSACVCCSEEGSGMWCTMLLG